MRAHPGTRPDWWWTFCAPEPRQRVGGTGQPTFEVLAEAPVYDRGVPAAWITADDADVLDMAGHDAVADPADPPLYESQATFLRRHRLLAEGERQRLSRAAFDPEAVDVTGPEG